MTQPLPWLTRVRIKNYRSIAECDVTLGPLTLLIGPNGSGKSNFLDALRFLSDAVATTPYQAVDAHGGFGEVLRRVPEPAATFSISIDIELAYEKDVVPVTYGFEIGRNSRRGERPVEVVKEEMYVEGNARIQVDRGVVQGIPAYSIGEIGSDRLLLSATGLGYVARQVFRRLQGMEFYNLEATTLRQPQREAEGATLGHHGEHLPDAVGQLGDAEKQRFDEYLAAIAPGIEGLDRRYPGGGYVTVEMRQHGDVAFGPAGMSDGTIRAAGVLAALFQAGVQSGQVSLVGIEEPELALHPGAAGVLFDALTEASDHVQIIASSQSADLLDRDDLDPTMIRAVTMRDGLTVIGELDDASQTILREKRFTLGELMRSSQLSPRDAV